MREIQSESRIHVNLTGADYEIDTLAFLKVRTMASVCLEDIPGPSVPLAVHGIVQEKGRIRQPERTCFRAEECAGTGVHIRFGEGKVDHRGYRSVQSGGAPNRRGQADLRSGRAYGLRGTD